MSDTVLQWPHLWLTNAQDNLASRRIKEKQGAKLVTTGPKRYVSEESTEEIWLLTRDAWLNRYNT